MTGFIHGEVELAEATGIHVKKITAARIKHLRQGEHWDMCGQRVAYCTKGLAAVLEKVGAPLDFHALSSLEERTSLVKRVEADPTVQAKIVQFYPNPFRCRIELPDGQSGQMRIRNKKNFCAGMMVPVRLDAASKLYVLTRREPRFPGRW